MTKRNHEAPLGRMSPRLIRSLLTGIAGKVKDKTLTANQVLKLLAHAERLQRELKTVTIQKLKGELGHENTVEELSRTEPDRAKKESPFAWDRR